METVVFERTPAVIIPDDKNQLRARGDSVGPLDVQRAFQLQVIIAICAFVGRGRPMRLENLEDGIRQAPGLVKMMEIGLQIGRMTRAQNDNRLTSAIEA